MMKSELPAVSNFKSVCPKTHRPETGDLEAFWGGAVYELFRLFAEYINEKYDLRFAIPLWTETHGWTYTVGRSGVYLIKGIVIENDGFTAAGISVSDRETLTQLFEKVDELWLQNGGEFLRKIAEKNAKQAVRNKERLERERMEREALESIIVPGKYNVFRWPNKLDTGKLNRLYASDARGIHDDELADEIGLTLYLRCLFGKEDMAKMERGVIRCHNCGSDIAGKDDFRRCLCGYQYSYREYRRSYRRNNMPTGAASKAFELYMKEWPLAKTYPEKMIAIDRLLHEFHLSLISGTVHRPAAMNFIDGTRKQVEEIINRLAFGNRE